jgi:hypothetical protein
MYSNHHLLHHLYLLCRLFLFQLPKPEPLFHHHLIQQLLHLLMFLHRDVIHFLHLHNMLMHH